MKGRLIYLVALSGSGKDSVLDAAREAWPSAAYVSHGGSSRAPPKPWANPPRSSLMMRSPANGSPAGLRMKARHGVGPVYAASWQGAVEVAERLAVEQFPAMPRRGLAADHRAIGLALPLVIRRRASGG